MSYASLEDALLNGSGRERQFLCHVHGESNPSASVNSVTGAWFCYACHAGGWVDLSDVDLDPYSVRRYVNQIMERVASAKTVYPEGWLNFFDASGPGRYWLSRFDESTCHEHRLGHTPDGSWATIPFRGYDGSVMGVIMRSLTGERPKYKYPYDAKLSEQIYNYHRADKEMLVITEGATDAIAVDEVIPGHAMAIYGNRLSNTQAKLLHRYAPRVILVATDQDEGGELAFKTVRQKMAGYPVIRAEWDTYKDLASIPVEDRSDLLKWAVSEYDLPSLARVG